MRLRPPWSGEETSGLERDERGSVYQAGDGQAQKERTVAVYPEGKQWRKAEEPARIANAAEVQDKQLSNKQEIANQLWADGQPGGGKEPDGKSTEQADLGVCRVDAAEKVPADNERGAGRAQEKHESGVAAPVKCAVDNELREPLVRDERKVIGRP